MFQKEKPVSRKDMIAFLSNHPRYFTMNSWNRCTSYANNVKLYNLNLPEDVKDKAYSFLCAECPEWQYYLADKFFMFEVNTGYHVGFNGRSDGYLVLYQTESYGTDKKVRMCSMDADNDFDDWTHDELRARVDVVREFDKMCDEIRDNLIYYLHNTEIVEETYTIPQTRTIAKLVDLS